MSADRGPVGRRSVGWGALAALVALSAALHSGARPTTAAIRAVTAGAVTGGLLAVLAGAAERLVSTKEGEL